MLRPLNVQNTVEPQLMVQVSRYHFVIKIELVLVMLREVKKSKIKQEREFSTFRFSRPRFFCHHFHTYSQGGVLPAIAQRSKIFGPIAQRSNSSARMPRGHFVDLPAYKCLEVKVHCREVKFSLKNFFFARSAKKIFQTTFFSKKIEEQNYIAKKNVYFSVFFILI